MRTLMSLILLLNLTPLRAHLLEEAHILTDKYEIYSYLFHEHKELRDPNCHRQVFESRSPQTMIAMGCKLYQLEIGPLKVGAKRRWFKVMYQCDEGNFPFTAHCLLK